MAQAKSGEEYPNKGARFGLNSAYMKIRKPNLLNTLFLDIFMDVYDK